MFDLVDARGLATNVELSAQTGFLRSIGWDSINPQKTFLPMERFVFEALENAPAPCYPCKLAGLLCVRRCLTGGREGSRAAEAVRGTWDQGGDVVGSSRKKRGLLYKEQG